MEFVTSCRAKYLYFKSLQYHDGIPDPETEQRPLDEPVTGLVCGLIRA